MNIALQKVESSNVSAYGYDALSRTLAIEFKSGGVYHYAGVPVDVYARLVDAKSIGKFIGAEIRGKFKHTRIEKEAL